MRIAILCTALAAAACRPAEPAVIRFEEVPEEMGLRFRHELPGGGLDNLPESAMGGVALLDYDGDGRLDVFFSNGGWLDLLAGTTPRPANLAKCRLFRNLGGMRFADVTEKAGAGFTGFALGACVGDFDDDGDADLFVAGYGGDALLRNRGDGTFEDATRGSGIEPGWHAGAAFLDFDRDGTLDLFVGQYVSPRTAEGVVATDFEDEFPGPGAYRTEPSQLYRGRGDGTFEDVTAKAGVGAPGKAMGVLATDVDDDGWIDIVVANDTEANFVWRNQGDGTFLNAASVLGMAFGRDAEPRASMGVTAADLDGDGRLEYLTPDTRGGAVYQGRDHEGRDRYFSDRAGDWGFAAATSNNVGWADVVLDADNDARLDVYKVQGDVRTTFTQPSFLLVNEGGDRFRRRDAPPEGRATTGEIDVSGRGAAAGDFDDDGLEDLVVVSLNAKARLLRNATTGAGASLRVRLVGTTSNAMALGARLRGRVGDRHVVREVSGSSGYLSVNDTRQTIGLGRSNELQDVVVRWPSGREQRVGDLAPGEHVITEE